MLQNKMISQSPTFFLLKLICCMKWSYDERFSPRITHNDSTPHLRTQRARDKYHVDAHARFARRLLLLLLLLLLFSQYFNATMRSVVTGRYRSMAEPLSSCSRIARWVHHDAATLLLLQVRARSPARFRSFNFRMAHDTTAAVYRARKYGVLL